MARSATADSSEFISARLAAAVGSYLAATVVAIEILDSASGWGLLVQLAACAALGLTGRTWWVVLLAPLPILLSLPYGETDESYGIEAELIYVLELMATPVYAAVIAIGVGIGRRKAIRENAAERALVRFGLICGAVAVAVGTAAILVSSLD